ncbi:uncharacterized protein OCT59_021393 [Rhizophagus irregularis]|uniref:Uncharacterized protein n=2 Tax=Rhizophagus irregularis TaxID=588596 RepID=U9TDT3_RHIID|nr:hypothetical protein GLOIN_2v1788013 [Rhizophagus irregularis DAOM 181602=DAOM 197198]EXX54447.1 hypothetical protein RirG_234590 [Rhizophagus irregularis DAOM 197198w]POG60356.1 hypothetical protein GLOIN_2v1788013 [Rhizophagus irregularis DAOM 181602=DAOM 197198]UZO02915.1 hypothetical protein OCT59_021393 [Rhizophagus irregularis]GBC27419.2 hypothetical protein GLOIN_2v1788013 [Rhizophagus irregularis DAOM 181602=DAOM 197198]|eukprot:XP_025167222.1 hypothetical protein GLOIN_2v1788013 [Rhizophagus irregularis DAOM 181602=DAOM 197198]
MTEDKENKTKEDKNNKTEDKTKEVYGYKKEDRKKLFVLLSMKEEWNKAETNLARRTNLMITHLSIAIITIFIGVCLFLLAKYNNTNKILKITLPSLTGISGVLVLVRSFMEKFKLSKNNSTNLLQIIIDKTDETIPTLMKIPKDEFKELPIERHKNYESFLRRINYLIYLEKKFGIGFSILMSLYVIILAIISILLSTNLIDSSWRYADYFLAINIIAIGIVWVINIVLSYCVKLYEKIINLNNIPIKFISIPILILFIPLAIYYRLLKRTYLIEKDDYETYFGKYNTENDDVTFFGTEVEAKLVLNLVLKLLKYEETDDEIKKYLIKDLQNKVTRTCSCKEIEIKDDEYLCRKIKKYLMKNKMNDEENIKISAILAGRLIELIEKLETRNGKNHEDINIDELINKISGKLKTNEKSSNGNGKNHGDKEISGGALIEDWEKVPTDDKILKYFVENTENETLMKAYLMALKFKNPKYSNDKDVKDYKKYHTQNDDEIIKLAMKIIKKKIYRRYLRNDMKYFNFKKIYRYTANDDFKYFNREDFMNRIIKFLFLNNKIILKLEPIELTRKHKYEIKRLLSGLDLDDDSSESADK